MKKSQAIIDSRRDLTKNLKLPQEKTCEGGCGVIGIVGTEALPGSCIIRSCSQLRNRGNGKGGGVAAAGLFPEYSKAYATHIALLDPKAQKEVEEKFILPSFDVLHSEWQPNIDDHRDAGLEICPPRVHRYFVQPKSSALEAFQEKLGISDPETAAQELVYQSSFRLNHSLYAQPSQPQAFVLSHGRDLMILKAVGFAEQVAEYYCLKDTKAKVWIGHQRYPTRGRVWHPGGAHPFVGVNEALVHNGDFANYYAVTEYLKQRGIAPLFTTDTEVSVLLFDFYSRVLGYPLEYVIEALAPTPEGDFRRLSKRKQRIYRAIQSAHLHGSPDGPWFFIIARTDPETGDPQLIGITDVSMLRPQVFAFQKLGKGGIGAIASEKQAIDAFFEEVAKTSPKVLPTADRYWNARGGSCTDGGAFVFTVKKERRTYTLDVRDKFGKAVPLSEGGREDSRSDRHSLSRAFSTSPSRLERMLSDQDVYFEESSGTEDLASTTEASLSYETLGRREERTVWGELADRSILQKTATKLRGFLAEKQFNQWKKELDRFTSENGILDALLVLTFLRDRHWDTGRLRRAHALSLIDTEIRELLDQVPRPGAENSNGLLRITVEDPWDALFVDGSQQHRALVIDAEGFPPEGAQAVSRLIVAGYAAGWKRCIVYRTRGDRFIGCGLGPNSCDIRIDVYGSSGDYLGSGIDGAHIYVHGNAQDQVGQILKSGRIVIFGDVGQTFLYGAKGGEVFVKGNAAGRPLINAVGQIRAVINGSCLDYCAESFMAGRQTGDGFVIINGINFDESGSVIGLEQKYSGNNLFSLASGGACYLNDPYHTVKPAQLNGAEFIPFRQADWNVIAEYLRFNEVFFGLSIRRDLLLVDGVIRWPKEVFRKIVASPQTSNLDWSSLPD